MTKKLVEKFIDIEVTRLCNILSEHCEYDLYYMGVNVGHQSYEKLRNFCKGFTDEKLRFFCKGLSDENFDTLLEESQRFNSQKNLLITWIYNGIDWIVNENITLADIINNDLNQKPEFRLTEKDAQKIKMILTDDKDFNIATEIYEKCLSKIGNLVALTDIMNYLRINNKCILYRKSDYLFSNTIYGNN
jgi:hypothetical protein